MIDRTEAVEIARAAAGDLGHAVEELHVATVVTREQTWEVLFTDDRYARGGGIQVQVDMITGHVTGTTPQL